MERLEKRCAEIISTDARSSLPDIEEGRASAMERPEQPRAPEVNANEEITTGLGLVTGEESVTGEPEQTLQNLHEWQAGATPGMKEGKSSVMARLVGMWATARQTITSGISNAASKGSVSGYWNRWWRLLAALSISSVVAIYIIIPSVFYFSRAIRREAIFGHHKHDVRMSYMDNPQDHGMPCTKLLYYNLSDGNRIGVWEMALQEHNCSMYRGERPLIFFLHGNSGTRSTDARKDKYRMFRKLGLEVVTLDYRGFGDSQGYPTAEHVVEDVNTVFKAIKEHKPASQIIVWGHSLGSGIAVKFLSRLKENVGGLVLETPFDRVGNVLLYHRQTSLLRRLPCFKRVFVDRVNNHPDTAFNSIDYVKDINADLPVLILATEDDATVPSILASNLYDGFVKYRNSTLNTFMKVFEAKFGYGHMFIHESRETPQIVQNFVQICCKDS